LNEKSLGKNNYYEDFGEVKNSIFTKNPKNAEKTVFEQLPKAQITFS
jgi:hypothetical protein